MELLAHGRVHSCFNAFSSTFSPHKSSLVRRTSINADKESIKRSKAYKLMFRVLDFLSEKIN